MTWRAHGRLMALAGAAASTRPVLIQSNWLVRIAADQAFFEAWRRAKPYRTRRRNRHRGTGPWIKTCPRFSPPNGESAEAGHPETLVLANRAGDLIERQLKGHRN